MRLPDDTKRLAIVGRTGSGKTRAGVWHLSKRQADIIPWITIDFKRDDLIAQIPHMEEINVNAKVPKEAGHYVVRPLPFQEAEVEALLWRVWQRGDCGVYVDEGYMMNDTPALRALLTQGRSLHIPMIILSQRPVWMSRFVFSEADFVQLFHLSDDRDMKTVTAFMPNKVATKLPPYHSWYYDIGADELTCLSPVPSDDEILESFERFKKRKRFFA